MAQITLPPHPSAVSNGRGSPGASGDEPATAFVSALGVALVVGAVLLVALALLSARDSPASRAEALAAILAFGKTICWPLVVVAVAVLLRGPLAAGFAALQEGLASRPPPENSFANLLGQSIEGVTSALSSAHDQYRGPMSERRRTQLKGQLAEAFLNGETESLRLRRILWLHKVQEHDQSEAEAFRRCGAIVHFFFSVNEALRAIRDVSPNFYDIIISHWGDSEDALQLYDGMPEAQRSLPFIIYTRKYTLPTVLEQAASRSINNITGEPVELFRMVMTAVQTLPPPGARSRPPADGRRLRADGVPADSGPTVIAERITRTVAEDYFLRS